MNEKSQLQNGIKVIGVIATVYFVMKYIVPLIIPFLFGLALVLMIRPVIMWIYRRIPIYKGILGFLFILILLGLLGVGIGFLIHIIWKQLQGLWVNKEEIIQAYCGTYEFCCKKFGTFFGKEQEEMKLLIETSLVNFYGTVRKTLWPNVMSGSLLCIKKGLKVIGITVIGIISFLLLLKDYDEMKEQAEKSVVGRKAIAIGKRILEGVCAYFKAQGIIMLIIGSICSVALFLLGNSYAILIGLVIGLLDALPFIGTGIILIPWGVFVIIQGNFLEGFSYLGLYLICSFTREYLEARLVGNKLGVPSFMILVSIYVGIQLFGLGGFFLGPLSYMIISSILEEEKT